MEDFVAFKRGNKLFIDASDIINGERQDTYGNPENNFAAIAARWSQFLKARGFMPASGVDLTAKDVAFMMVDFKMARQCSSPKRDNLIDAAGYLGILDDLEGNK